MRAGVGILAVVPENGRVVSIHARCRGKILFRLGWSRGLIVGRGEIYLIGGFRHSPSPDPRDPPAIEWVPEDKISFASHDIEIVPAPDWMERSLGDS